MKKSNRTRKWLASLLAVTLLLGWAPGYRAAAAGSEVLDQQNTNFSSNSWVNATYSRYQTFTPSISGSLSRIEINSAGAYGTFETIVSIFKESDLSTPLATVQKSALGDGWHSFEFSSMPYLKRNTMYRMVVSTDNGGSSGFGWYMGGGNPYPGGSSPAAGYDYAFRTYMLPDDSISAEESRIEAASANLVADGVSSTTITVSLRDAQGKPDSSSGAAVGMESTLGSLDSVTDNGDGTYSAKLTAPKATGTAIVSASVAGVPLTMTASVQFVAGDPSVGTSTIETVDATLTADGTSQTTVIVTLKDAYGNLAAGGSVGIQSTLGKVGSITNHGYGTYTATLTAPTTPGTATVNASLAGVPLASTASVQFLIGPPSSAKSTIETGAASLTANGTDNTTVTVKLKDEQGSPYTTGGASVGIQSTLGDVGTVTDNGDGTYTATLKAPTTTGTATVSANVAGVPLTGTASVQFVAGAPSAEESTLETDDASLTADESSQTKVTVKLKDAYGNSVATGGFNVKISTTLGEIGAVTSLGDGTYTATLTAPTSLGSATVRASINNEALKATAQVAFVVGPISLADSTAESDAAILRADGSSQAAITVRLKDAYGHPLAARDVHLEGDGGSAMIEDDTLQTDEDGVAVFQVSSDSAETVVFTAMDTASGSTLVQKPQIDFVYDQPPSIALTADSTVPTFDSVNVSAAATAYGKYNSISRVKWASGSRSVSYFADGGTETTASFSVSDNGTYTVYAVDRSGNEAVREIVVSNILQKSGDANLSDWQLVGDGKAIPLSFDPAKTTYTVYLNSSVRTLQMNLTAANSYSMLYVNGGEIVPGALTDEYSLNKAKNEFEIRVQAQDGTIKKYSLSVVRRSAASGSVAAAPSAEEPKIKLNGQAFEGDVSVSVDANGRKTIAAALNEELIGKLFGSAAVGDKHLIVDVQEKADRYELTLSGGAVKALTAEVPSLTLRTALGEYRLPLAELAAAGHSWPAGSELKLVIGIGEGESVSGLREAAAQGGFQTVEDPVVFGLYEGREGKSREITHFGRFVERLIYLTEEQAAKVSTVVVWDPKSGVRPVPTEIVKEDGRSAALIRSMTNSVYVPVSKPSTLTDLKGHWAEAEIREMSGRMIVQGTEDGRFDPNAGITRAELAALLVRALGLPAGTEPSGFSDVEASSWYGGVVSSAKTYGLMGGMGDGTFRPNQQVSRQEAIVMVVRALRLAKGDSEGSSSQAQAALSGYADSSRVAGWATDAMSSAIAAGLLQGEGGELQPLRALTRAEAAVLLYRMLQASELIG